MLNPTMVRVVGAFVLVGVTLTLATAEAAKGGGGGTDPCQQAGLDFPAFVYRNISGKTHTVYVTDAQGKCKRVVTTSSISLSAPKLSYPIDGMTNKGRIIFFQGAGAVHAVDFTVGAGNTVSPTSKRQLLITDGCCSLDLSRDGQTIYFSDTGTSLARVPVATPFNPQRIYALPPEDSSWFLTLGSVNGDETKIFATKMGSGDKAGGSQLVRIDLETQTAIVLREWLPQDGYGANPFWPSADKHSPRVAFNDYILNSNNCTPLTVTDYDGNELFPSTFTMDRMGRDPTWVGDEVVMQRRTPMDGSGKCSTSTSISMIDLDNNAETALVTGYNPDGR